MLSERFTVIAHRAGAALGPENDPATIALADFCGATAVEFDVHQCADGALVVTHDEAVDWHSDPKWLADLNWNDAARLWPAAGVGLYCLGDIVDACRAADVGIYLDIKQLGPGGLRALTKACDGVPTIFASARSDLVDEAVDHGLVAAWLVNDRWTDPVAVAARCGTPIVHPCFDTDPADLGPWAPAWFRRAEHHGPEIVSWTVHTPAAVRTVREWGATAVCVDDPAIVRLSTGTATTGQ